MRIGYPPIVKTAFRSFIVRSGSIKSVHTEPKFCVNCEHYLPSERYEPSDPLRLEFAKCFAHLRETNDDTYLISGVPKPKGINYQYCSIARSWQNMCGPQGSKYIAKGEQKDDQNKEKV